MTVRQQSLRDRQVGRPRLLLQLCLNVDADNASLPASLEKIFNLNHTSAEPSAVQHDPAAANGLIPQATPVLNSDGDPIWKVLVFDNLGKEIVSSVLRVNDLRRWGVTIHLFVQADLVLYAYTKIESIGASTAQDIPFQTCPFYTFSNRPQRILAS